ERGRPAPRRIPARPVRPAVAGGSAGESSSRAGPARRAWVQSLGGQPARVAATRTIFVAKTAPRDGPAASGQAAVPAPGSESGGVFWTAASTNLVNRHAAPPR